MNYFVLTNYTAPHLDPNTNEKLGDELLFDKGQLVSGVSIVYHNKAQRKSHNVILLPSGHLIPTCFVEAYLPSQTSTDNAEDVSENYAKIVKATNVNLLKDTMAMYKKSTTGAVIGLFVFGFGALYFQKNVVLLSAIGAGIGGYAGYKISKLPKLDEIVSQASGLKKEVQTNDLNSKTKK